MFDFFPQAGAVVDASSIQRLREKIDVDGRLPAGILRAEIDASWRRSMSHGVGCTDDSRMRLQQDTELDRLYELRHALFEASAPELGFLAKRYGNQGVVVLADANATVLTVEGRVDRMRGLGVHDMVPGACWSEELRGTNALGTALIEGGPIFINSGEHFLSRLSRFSCASVPVRNPFGEISAVLDVTREGSTVHPHDSLSMLLLAASQIEGRLMGSYFSNEIVLAFHSRQPYLDSPWRGLVAMTQDGKILAADTTACALLGLDRAQIVGQQGEDFFGMPCAALVARLAREPIVHCRNGAASFYFKAVQIPVRPLQMPVVSKPRVAASPSPLRLVSGENPRLAQTLHMASRGLERDVPVLLQGETGTGKEVAARALHDAGSRASKPFVAVNCAAIPEGLIESELFGYKEGAFTGARKGGATGRLMQAHGGTLFLDEIGDMPFHLQARLLRVLQERKVMPLGGTEEKSVDFALICATHRDLKALVREGKFREDLYYRVNGFGVTLPPLREREDIHALIRVLLDKLGAPEATLSPELVGLFGRFDWPGNTRQLEMVLRTALAVRDEEHDELGVMHLSSNFYDELQNSCRPMGGLMQERELELIRSSMESHNGNVSAVAEALGISRATIYRKLKQLRCQA
ncbi:sigma-54-dependent Fis family transcriptional regulator [Brachymonas denitrificans]|uniref:sigma-54-dependent Fis family transcriptional regulator n=1 Tax=Brachymonas denitrificans TaxID=28220 RepID=UPI002AFFBCDB|nr:sigma-54-dependent Fis family transcriptional regulator [Brachymonas denitrificans]